MSNPIKQKNQDWPLAAIATVTALVTLVVWGVSFMDQDDWEIEGSLKEHFEANFSSCPGTGGDVTQHPERACGTPNSGPEQQPPSLPPELQGMGTVQAAPKPPPPPPTPPLPRNQALVNLLLGDSPSLQVCALPDDTSHWYAMTGSGSAYVFDAWTRDPSYPGIITIDFGVEGGYRELTSNEHDKAFTYEAPGSYRIVIADKHPLGAILTKLAECTVEVTE